MESRIIQSVAEYVGLVCEKNLEMKKNGQKGDVLLFRGQADKDNELIPSLGRKTREGNSLLEDERKMIEMAKYKLPTVFRKDLEPLELLALLQHHGIPTRLLDVSENALVGLYFACHDNRYTYDLDGEVIVFKSNEMADVNVLLVNSICETYQRGHEFTEDELCKLKENKIRFVYAPSYSLRQNIQGGRYILFSNALTEEENGIRLIDEIRPISKEKEPVLLRIIVPAKAKKQIRRDLRLLGVSRELLFLDNADMVCSEIAEVVQGGRTV